MKLHLSWLREYVGTKTSADVLADRFIHTSSELEETIDWKSRLAGVVVGAVLEKRAHPNASKLSILAVDIGTGTLLSIVCGASNVREGLRVAVATVGSILTTHTGEKLEIQKAVIRGEQSEGMICAREELGFLPGNAHQIWELPASTQVGASLSEVLGLSDFTLDLEITPNRPDLLSVYGLAREVSAFERRPLKEMSLQSVEGTGGRLQHRADITITSKESSHKAACVPVTMLSGAYTPLMVQGRLLASGIQPVNPVVDAANYVMLECGQPLHVYDYNKLCSGAEMPRLSVETLKKTEWFEALDGKKYTLEKGDTVVRQGETIVALGGIIGGKSSAVTPESREMLIESVCFTHPAIRAASRRLGLRSEASLRSEKGTDQELVVLAVKRLLELLSLWRIAEPTGKLVDTKLQRHERKPITIHTGDVSLYLGITVNTPDIRHILQSLGFRILTATKSSLTCVPPSWRADVRALEDLIEEVARLWGFDRIGEMHITGNVPPPQSNTNWERTNIIRRALASCGYNETVLLPFCSLHAASLLGYEEQQLVALNNPLNATVNYLSPSGIIALMAALSEDQTEKEHFLFEIAKRFARKGSANTEMRSLAMICHGDTSAEGLFSDMKGAIEYALQTSGISEQLTFSRFIDAPYGARASVLFCDAEVGSLLLFSAKTLAKHKIRRGKHVLGLEIAIDSILKEPGRQVQYTVKPAYPVVTRDVSLHLSGVRWENIATMVPGTHGDIAISPPVLIDRHRQDAATSITIRLTYSADRTLTDEEVRVAHEAVLHDIASLEGVSIRD